MEADALSLIILASDMLLAHTPSLVLLVSLTAFPFFSPRSLSCVSS